MDGTRSHHRWGLTFLLGACSFGSSCDSGAPPIGPKQIQPPVEGLGVLPTDRSAPWQVVDDARRDGWDSEVASAAASDLLKALAKLFLATRPLTDEDFRSIASESFECGDLLPSGLAVAFDDGPLKVRRWERLPDSPRTSPPASKGPRGLRAAVDALRKPFLGATSVRFEPKVFGIKKSGTVIVTRQYVAISGVTGKGRLEWNALWEARWGAQEPAGPPRLESMDVIEHEEITLAQPETLLADCTESVLGGNPSYAAQFLHGLNYWLERLQETRFFALLGTPGLAVGDVNGDGLDDLYVCQEGGLPNRLFLQRPDGTAVDASEGSGANWVDSTRSALLVDLDNDHDLDLVAAALGAIVFAAGDGKGHFDLREALLTSQDTMSLSAADYDSDGDLDVYLCAYKQDDLSQDPGVLSIGATGGFVYHDSNTGARNYLLRNDILSADPPRDGRWRFRDVTVETGLDVNNRRFSFAASWEDFDNDGDQDLYVANDFGRNNLYRNDSRPGSPPYFVDVAREAGAEDSASGMGVTWGDYDRNGWMDLHVSNMFSAAGNRITFQAQFKADATSEVKSRLQRFARGDTLLQSVGDGTFADRSEDARITMGRWAWSSNFTDLNNDGWEDLVVANGYVTTEDTGDL